MTAAPLATLRRESLLMHARGHLVACEAQLAMQAEIARLLPETDATLLAAYEQTLRAGVSFARLVIATLEGT